MSDAEDLKVTNNTAESRLEIHLGDEVAFAEYRLEPDAIVFPHTVVPEAFGGRGVGGKLVKAGLAFAEEKGLLVKPTCPFFHAYISKHPELHDRVHPSMRDGLKTP